MPAGQGVLAIRDAEETESLGVPTRFTGTVDEETGVISGATLSTPPLEFDTVALGLDVHVTATFTQVTPGGGTGLVSATPPAAPSGEDQKGTVTLRDAVYVDLVLEIGDPLILEAHCVTPAVNLELLSEGAYTESEGGLVVDSNFTVPPVEVNNPENCISQVVEGVNSLLAGPGHSLSLYVEGDLPVPELKPETATTLSVEPGEGSLRGTPVTLTAAVAEVDPNPLDPTGSVVFREDTKVVGSAEIQPDGTATLTTTDLRAGTRNLTASYQGDAEFAGSTSAPVSYTVSPAPILTGDFPEFITRGAEPTEFDISIDNRASSRPLANGRVDVLLPWLNIGNLVLEQQLPDDSWVEIVMPYDFDLGGAAGTLGPDGGVLVPAGAVVSYHLRVSAPASTPARTASIEFSLVSVDPETSDEQPVTTTSWPFNTVQADRQATTMNVEAYDMAGLRPGNTFYVEAYVSTTTGPVTTGQVEFLIDGQVMPFRRLASFGPIAPLQTRATLDGGQANGSIILPTTLATGPHVVSARYLGDASFLPSTTTAAEGERFVLTINEPLGPLYTCYFTSVISEQFGAYVQAYVRLPAYAEAGDELDLEDLEVTVVPGGAITPSILGLMSTDGTNGVNAVEIDLGATGIIEGDALEYFPNFDSGDQLLTVQGLEGSIVVDGEPGEVMSLPIEQIVMSGIEPTVGAQFTFTCLPQAEPVLLEEVGVAGVSLTAGSATDPVRRGDEVVLTATAAPAGPTGLIEFFSGSQSLGTAPGREGTATITIDDLPVGSNVLTARYYGVLGNLYESDAFVVEVRPAVECAESAVSGTSATVRLVYLELLGRCPDQAGFDYWKGRLDGGTSPEVFARAISATPEAVGMVVDDAYVTMLGRKADASGRAFWVERMRSGTGRYDQLLADLGSSPEFWSQSGSSNAGFVGRVYEQLLNRTPDQAGQDFWVGRLDAGTSPRALIRSLANLDEPLGVLVTDSYVEILGRTPDTAEKADGIAFLRRTGDRSGLYAQLIGDPEFATRAQSFPNPEDG